MIFFVDWDLPAARIRDEIFSRAFDILVNLPLNAKTTSECITFFLMHCSYNDLLFVRGSTHKLLKFAIID